jgi:chromatin segregation and condensation protein Rec8/ScpA/Scc1 (kleisin family)
LFYGTPDPVELISRHPSEYSEMKQKVRELEAERERLQRSEREKDSDMPEHPGTNKRRRLDSGISSRVQTEIAGKRLAPSNFIPSNIP